MFTYIPHTCMQRQNCEHLILSIFTGTQVIHRKLGFFFCYWWKRHAKVCAPSIDLLRITAMNTCIQEFKIPEFCQPCDWKNRFPSTAELNFYIDFSYITWHNIHTALANISIHTCGQSSDTVSPHKPAVTELHHVQNLPNLLAMG